MVSDRTVLPPIRCLGFVGYRSCRGRNEFRSMYALTTLPRRTTPLIEPPSGQYSPVRCVARPSSRVRARVLPVQHLLRGGYERGLHAFQGGQRHHGRFGTPEEERGAGGRGGGGEQLTESPSSRHRFGVCFMLTMPGSSRNHPSSRGR